MKPTRQQTGTTPPHPAPARREAPTPLDLACDIAADHDRDTTEVDGGSDDRGGQHRPHHRPSACLRPAFCGHTLTSSPPLCYSGAGLSRQMRR